MSAAGLQREGAAHMAALDYAEAERCFRAALGIEPGNLLTLNNLAVALHEQGRLAEARKMLEDVIAGMPDYAAARFNLGRVHMELDELGSALACFEEVLRRDPADADTFVMIGAALERRGEFGEAEEYFAEAAQFSQVYAVTEMLRFSAEFLRVIAAVGKPIPLPEPVLRAESPHAAESVVLVTCDPHYLRKYGLAFARSYAQTAGRADLLHLHVLDPDEHILAEAQILLRRAGILHCCVTTERDARFGAGSAEKRTWFTCARFRHLEAWLEAYGVPIVMLDIDAALQAPVATLIAAAGSADMGLFLRRPRRAPWLDLLAGTFVARPTPAAREYLRLVRNYIDYFLEQDTPRWHLDQCALYCTLRMLEAHGSAPAVVSITDAVQANVYHVGNNHDARMADPRYARFTAEH
ncbi:MAG TPA: tetratricopeptide repeat protein [Burkholderiales bacterium]